MTKAKARKPNRNGVLEVSHNEGRSKERRLADISLDPAATGMATALAFAKGTFGEQNVTELYAAMKDKVQAVKDGNLAGAEARLTAQAIALDLIFTELARRAALNMAEYIEASERYMRLALKAQAQSRATMETLAALKNPPVVYARQANISAGHQQINNHSRESDSSPAKKTATRQNELLETENGSRLDSEATSTAERGDPPVEAVAAVNRPEERGRQAPLEPQR